MFFLLFSSPLRNIPKAKAKAKGMIVAAAAFDYSAAFDTIDHSMTLKKLAKLGIMDKENTWFKSYLHNRFQCVDTGEGKSTPLPITCGVPQGSILGPVLFTALMAELPDYLAINEGTGGVVAYADDVCVWVFAQTATAAQTELERIASRMAEYSASHHLSLNESKTQVVWFNKGISPAVQ